MALVGEIYNPTFLYYKDLQSEIKKIHFKNRICYWIKNPKNTRTWIAITPFGHDRWFPVAVRNFIHLKRKAYPRGRDPWL